MQEEDVTTEESEFGMDTRRALVLVLNNPFASDYARKWCTQNVMYTRMIPFGVREG